jgi:hypothetical protein
MTEYRCLDEHMTLGRNLVNALIHIRDTGHRVQSRRIVAEEVKLLGLGAARDSGGRIIYSESGNYGSCVRCGRTLNDNVDQGDICYGCEETIHAES